MHLTTVIFILCILLFDTSSVKAFFPNYLYTCDYEEADREQLKVDHTHESITELALARVIDELLETESWSGK